MSMDGSGMPGLGQGAPRWGLGTRLLHWLTVFALGWQLVVGFFLFGPGMATHEWMPLHISIGAAVLAVVAVRITWRALGRRPGHTGQRALRLLEAAVHVSLYALVIAVVTTGWLAYRPAPFMPPARLFGLFVVPGAPHIAAFTARQLAEVHSFLVWALLALIAAHIIAALAHAVIMRDGILQGMLWNRSARTKVDAPPVGQTEPRSPS
jgi:cytochrome b561